jgi:enamine deaminase RidA (YjgF/YER057c/UK114 family)
VQPERRLGLDVLHPAASSTVLRRIAGPQANELAILCRPEVRWPDVARQAETAYRELSRVLTANQASFRDLTSETLFLRDIRRDLPIVLDVRTQVVAGLGQSNSAPLPAFIQQAPIGHDASFELSVSAVVPRQRDPWSVRDVRAVPSCACEGCARSGARLVRHGDQASLHTTNVYGAGGDAYEQVWNMFCAAERLLEQCGMGFRDVVRTWIHLRDIDRDYDALNRARRDFFQQRGVELRPASTGVQGAPFPAAHDFSLSILALQSGRARDVTRMSTPTLNEAWSYGADFSRGLRIAEANKVSLYISGTASIDEAGRSIHPGDFEAQATRMLDNIAALLAQQGASFENLVSGVTYLKNPGHEPMLRSIYRRRGFDKFPCPIVEAPLCRPELLCETEAVAMLPLTATAA